MQRRVFKQTGALAAGTVVGGLFAYAFFALATRYLGARAAAPVSVLWTYWTMMAAILTFPLQHWTVRLLTEGAEGALAGAQRRIWIGTAGLSALSGLLSYLARDSLFHEPTVAFPVMMAGVTAGAALSGMVRGSLAGHGRYAATGWSLAAENMLRLALGLVAALAGRGSVAFGLALVLGSLSGLAWRARLRFEREGASVSSSIASPLALASGLAAGSLIAQVVLMGTPIALAALGGSPRQITSLFIGLAVWRAPYLVALGVAPQLTSVLTAMILAGDWKRVRKMRRRALLGVIGAVAVSFIVGTTIAGAVLRIVFGPGIVLDGLSLGLIGAGTTVAVGNLALLLLMLAAGTSRPVNRAWAMAATVGAAVLVAGPSTPLDRVVAAFLAAQVTAFVSLMVAPLGRQKSPATMAGTATDPAPPGM